MGMLAGIRLMVLSAFAAFVMVLPLHAEDAPPAPDAWQTVISSQIRALRINDAATALSYAEATFQQRYPDAEQFVLMITQTGYKPIVTSRSHSFGDYRIVAPDDVFQQVFLVDEDQSLYQAIYELKMEGAGWRVAGVQLARQPGLGV
ncbi:MAG: DUF4864 domain-containing protein [Devosia sp.]